MSSIWRASSILKPKPKLNRELKKLEDKTTAQVVVLTIDTLEGEPMEKFSLRTAEKWALGQKGKDNGVLITVSLKEGKYRIEVGHALESILPDSLVRSIGRECFKYNFWIGRYSVGISEAVTFINRQIIVEKYGFFIDPDEEETKKFNLFLINIVNFFIFCILIFIILRIIRGLIFNE